MAFKAAGAYISRLRKGKRLSRLGFAKMVGTSDSNIMRIELGDQEPRGGLLALIIRNLDANPDDLFDFYLSPDAEESEGIARAEEWIRKRQNNQQKPPEFHSDVLKLLSQMSEYELGKWVSLGERLLEERKQAK